MKISSDFFNRDAKKVARDLLGFELIRRIGRKEIRSVIIETEAYCGPRDKACHAFKGRTRRTETLYGLPGTIYVYLIYGMYYCLNIVTGPKEYPAAVLIRGVKLLKNGGSIHGPGRVTRALAVTNLFNNKNICKEKGLFIGRKIIKPKKIRATPRIGIDYAEEWAPKPLRFLIPEGNVLK